MLIAGKIALVTGAGGGIGSVIAHDLAEAGADIVMADVVPGSENTVKAIEALGRIVMVVQFDIADVGQVTSAAKKVAEQLGPVDILVNCAAVTNNVSLIVNMAPDAWEREMAVNASGAFYLTRAVLPSMMARGWGRIINISSLAADRGGYGQPGYVASKAALLGLTKATALECARFGITCNAILPGLIDTGASSKLPEKIKERFIRAIPIRRAGEPQDVSNLVVYLASDKARYINGAEIHVDAGAHLLHI
jgi:NAD(P)-dependent dehydrogenase (short-subunit alcohol dehydrogenase family)